MGPVSIGVEVQRNTDGDTPSCMVKVKASDFMKVLAFITSRKRHEAIVHNKIKPFECELFQNRFAVKSNLEGHKRSCHNFPKLKCEHYEAQFCYAFSLNKHKKNAIASCRFLLVIVAKTFWHT